MADGESEDTANDALDVNDNVNGSEENKDSEGDGDSADPQVIITNVDADDDSNDSAEGENSDKSALNDDPMAGLNRMDDIEDVTDDDE